MSGKKETLSITHPGLAAEADGWEPSTITAGSNKKVGWKCEFGHRWSSVVSNRVQGSGCPACSGRMPILGTTDLVTTNPELGAQADGWDPRTVTRGSDKKVGWKCEFGHRWRARVSSRSAGNGCPVCANRVVSIGFNDLATINPELAAQADGWDPREYVAFSNKRLSWVCSSNHKWFATLASRSSGSGCPTCSGLIVERGVNDLATKNPELAAQADGWDPTTFSEFSNKKVQWVCRLEHKWKASVGDRSGGRGCPICSGQKVLAGFNDLATKNPELAAQADGWDPTTVAAHTHRSFKWKCERGHKWKATVNNRFRSGGCPFCSNKKLLIGFNDLASTNPELAAQADGWDPTLIFANSGKSFNWKCERGHKWKATSNNRSGGRGCPSCAQHGFNPSKDAWLYLIEDDLRDMYQIGISNVPESRLRKHFSRGWKFLEVRGPMDGFLTQELEASSLSALKRRGALLGRKGSLEKFDGHTEAWSKSSLNVKSIKQILDWVYEDDR